jgi:hypothetical protein
MTTQQRVMRDERTVAIENASYKWACLFLCYALFIEVIYRGVVRDEAAWDLLFLTCVPGIVCSIYQARKKTVSGWLAVFMVCSAVACAATITALYQFRLL